MSSPEEERTEAGGDGQPERTLGQDLLAQIIGVGVGQLADGQLAGSGDYVAVGVGALAMWFAPRLTKEIQGLRAARAYRVLEDAATLMGVDDPEAFAARVHQGHRPDFTWRVMEAAAETPLEEKATALARVLADGLVGDDTHLDEMFQILAALRDLEAPHIRVLAYFGHGVHGTEATEALDDVHANWSLATWYAPKTGMAGLLKQFPNYTVGMTGVVSVLVRHGLIHEIAPDLGRQLDERQRRNNLTRGGSGAFGAVVIEPSWEIDRLGWRVLQYLRAGALPTPQDGSEAHEADEGGAGTDGTN